MAKAADETTTTWILLREALATTIGYYQSTSLSKRLLVRALAAGQIRWRCCGLEGRKRLSDPSAGDAGFWRSEKGAGEPERLILDLRELVVNWEESWARRHGTHGYTAYRIEVPREDILAAPVAEPVRGIIEPGGGKERKQWQAERAEWALKKLYPQTGGIPPDGVKNMGVLEKKVERVLAEKGWSAHGAPSRQVIKKVIEKLCREQGLRSG
jgi:hypothetical protein